MTKWVIANFKMYKTVQDAVNYANEFKNLIVDCCNNVAVCPSFVCIKDMVTILKDTKVLVGAQNCATEEEGAYTGEVSAKMLGSVGAQLVILGHSERRRYYGETDQIVNQKIKKAHENNLIAVVCLADDGGVGFEENIKTQLRDLLDGIDKQKEIILAFEPVWAIGTGKTMQTKDIDPVCKVIKKEAKKLLGKDVKVLYGGSVNSSNAKEILNLKNVDGLLVGGASKKVDDFTKICNANS